MNGQKKARRDITFEFRKDNSMGKEFARPTRLKPSGLQIRPDDIECQNVLKKAPFHAFLYRVMRCQALRNG